MWLTWSRSSPREMNLSTICLFYSTNDQMCDLVKNGVLTLAIFFGHVSLKSSLENEDHNLANLSSFPLWETFKHVFQLSH